jgi:hypothetical protein
MLPQELSAADSCSQAAARSWPNRRSHHGGVVLHVHVGASSSVDPRAAVSSVLPLVPYWRRDELHCSNMWQRRQQHDAKHPLPNTSMRRPSHCVMLSAACPERVGCDGAQDRPCGCHAQHALSIPLAAHRTCMCSNLNNVCTSIRNLVYERPYR